jgi:two-component system phosphate regulon response regulator PhoB
MGAMGNSINACDMKDKPADSREKQNIIIFSGDKPLKDFDGYSSDIYLFRVIDDLTNPPLVRQAGGRIFVDWILPNLSGPELCRHIRSGDDNGWHHITLVLERDDDNLRRQALRAGADDYLVGPLSFEKVVAKLAASNKAVMSAPNPEERLIQGQLVIDEAARLVTYGRKVVHLMPNEFGLLRVLMTSPNRIFSRGEIISALGKSEGPVEERTVDVWIGRLRRALTEAGAKRDLRTVRGAGYILDVRPAPIPPKRH